MIDWDTFKAQLQTNPGKVLKSVMLLAGCFLLIWILVIVQSDSPQQKMVEIHNSGRLDSLQLSAGPLADNLAQRPSVERPALPEGDGTGLYVLIPIAFLLFIIIGGLWLYIRSKKSSKIGIEDRNIFTTIGSQQLPGGQQLMVIKLNGEYWVLTTGVNQEVKLLHRYAAEEWKKLEQKPADPKDGPSFWQTLQHTASKRGEK